MSDFPVQSSPYICFGHFNEFDVNFYYLQGLLRSEGILFSVTGYESAYVPLHNAVKLMIFEADRGKVVRLIEHCDNAELKKLLLRNESEMQRLTRFFQSAVQYFKRLLKL